MLRQIISPRLTAGRGSGLLRHPLVRVEAVAGVVLVMSLFVASASFAANRNVSNASAVQFFLGAKSCVSNPQPPLVVCNIVQSNVPLLQGATIDYVSVPESAGVGTMFERDDSDVVLTTAVLTRGQPSKAYGHCTFYSHTGTGICTYISGTNNLAGFHAAFAIGTNPDGTFSVIGKYWFDDNNGG